MLAADGTASACCSLWWRVVPAHADERLGVIGHFAARDPESAAMLLRRALAELTTQRCTLAVGPMDGNTWRQYRFVTERGAEPPFFLEPDNPDEYPRYWTDAGSTSLAGYSSTRVDRLDTDDDRLAEFARRAADQDIRIRPIDATRLEAELRGVYRVAEISFRRNFLYTPAHDAAVTVIPTRLCREGSRGGMTHVLRPELAWAAIDEVWSMPVPVDGRHNAKVDYPALRSQLERHHGNAI